MVRAGSIRIIESATALTAERISFLRSESLAYRDAWRSAT
jgi:hypothetical protein